MGDYIVTEVIESVSRRIVELSTGRDIEVAEGDLLVGAFGRREATLEAFPERGMGLLMLQACTEELSYRRIDEGWQRLEFSVSAEQDPWLHIPF